MERYIIAAYVENKSGVLTRVTSMFTRRGFNIDTLTVGATENPAYSRITLTVLGDEYIKTQIVNQLTKLYNVHKVEVLEPAASVRRELMLMKIAVTRETRQEIMTAFEVFKARVFDYNPDSIVVEVTGVSSKLDAFIENMKPYGIIEMCRTGVCALSKGSKPMVSETELN